MWVSVIHVVSARIALAALPLQPPSALPLRLVLLRFLVFVLRQIKANRRAARLTLPLAPAERASCPRLCCCRGGGWSQLLAQQTPQLSTTLLLPEGVH